MTAVFPRIGCPVWAHAPWVGKFFTSDAKRDDYLRQYSGVFDTAEGNATFYGIPKADTVSRWRQEASASFRFCFKFPRIITHGRQLVGAKTELTEFFERLDPLGEKLGPFFLQLPAEFGPDRLNVLADFLAGLPDAYRYAVEVRHLDFYDNAEHEKRINAVLAERRVDRVIFDTRGLFASLGSDPATLEAKAKKPRVPVHIAATGEHPFVRFVGDPVVEKNAEALKTWAKQLARWCSEGKSPYFFTHHPDEVFAPQLGRKLQENLRALNPQFAQPPKWPCETGEGQLSLL